jgi:hypothetical protein
MGRPHATRAAVRMLGARVVGACDGPKRSRVTGRGRACLETLLDAYVEAVVARDPQRLPLALSSEPRG